MPRQRSNTRLWIILGAIGVLALLLWLGFGLLKNSTPTQTLTDYCNALKSGDYQAAFNLVTSTLQIDGEQVFANNEQQFIAGHHGISNCSVIRVVEDNGSTAFVEISYTYGDGGTESHTYELFKENGTWKVGDAPYQLRIASCALSKEAFRFWHAFVCRSYEGFF